jgi:hypothetical protein
MAPAASSLPCWSKREFRLLQHLPGRTEPQRERHSGRAPALRVCRTRWNWFARLGIVPPPE